MVLNDLRALTRLCRGGPTTCHLYGAPWLQTVAIVGRSRSRGSRRNKRKPLRPVATRCLRTSMVRNAMKEGLPRSHAPRVLERRREAPRNVVRRIGSQPQASRLPPARRGGRNDRAGAAPPDADGLRGLTARIGRFGEPVFAAIESMNGARFVHDQLELAGWRVEIADAVKVKGLAPLACKTDRIDAWVLAELARRDLVPAIWLPDPEIRAERERARFRLHLVRHRTSLKQRIHAVLLAHGKPCPVSDLFGLAGRDLLERLELPEPWTSTVAASLQLIDELDQQIDDCERDLQRLGAEHRYVPLLVTVP